MQILEIKKIKFNGSILDLGSKKSGSNVTNFINSNENINYADKYSNNANDLKIDLEKNEDLNDIEYENVLLMNVLEHVFNFKNCLNNSYKILSKNGNFYGSTPFFFRIHESPNDYFRYTEQSLIVILNEAGFKNISIKVIGGGIFLCFYDSISTIFNIIPLLNNLLLIFCQILDFIISLFSKNFKKIYPLGYFFFAEK